MNLYKLIFAMLRIPDGALPIPEKLRGIMKTVYGRFASRAKSPAMFFSMQSVSNATKPLYSQG